MNIRNDVIKEIRARIIPKLRNVGFTGTYPHFRRIYDDGKVDYLSFQFNKWGGSFVIELAVAYPYRGKNGNFYYWDEVTPEFIKKSDCGYTKERLRIEPKKGKWFEYNQENYVRIVDTALDKLMANMDYFDKPHRLLKV